jgi:hypothetical protein
MDINGLNCTPHAGTAAGAAPAAAAAPHPAFLPFLLLLLLLLQLQLPWHASRGGHSKRRRWRPTEDIFRRFLPRFHSPDSHREFLTLRCLLCHCQQQQLRRPNASSRSLSSSSRSLRSCRTSSRVPLLRAFGAGATAAVKITPYRRCCCREQYFLRRDGSQLFFLFRTPVATDFMGKDSSSKVG